MNIRIKSFLLGLSATAFAAASAQAQQPAAPIYTQTLVHVKTAPGKGQDYRRFVTETTMKVAQMRADAGEILTWTLLRSVYPAGQEARADYIISTMVEGPPRAPQTMTDELLKKAGVTMKASEVTAQRTSLSTLVSTEMWRPRFRVGAPQKGHFISLNFLKVHDEAKLLEYQRNVGLPMAQEALQQGATSGWIYATKMLPAGKEFAYSSYTANMYPSWEAAFKPRTGREMFEKVIKGKNYDETMADLAKLRDSSRRELWEVVERVEKKK